VLPLHSIIVLPLGTRCGCLLTVCGIRLTLAITWPQGVLGEEDTQTGAAQVNGGVRKW
jgi:hypothetical protein